MRLKADQLAASLKSLEAVYFISGGEPLQQIEATDAVRKAAKKEGYTTREIFSVETGFDWHELSVSADSFSIFSDKKLIDLRLSSGKPGNEGAKALTEYCQRLPADTILLITAPKLDKSTLKTKWFQSIEKVGVVVQVWPLEGADLIRWLQGRAQNRGLHIGLDGIKLIASRIEGNLLAAAQEIEKLYILYGEAEISKQNVEEVVADNSRYDVFKLTDCVLSGRVNRVIKILNGLKAEGVAAPVVLWAITREVRMLINIKSAIDQGQSKESVFKNYRLWDKRKQLVNSALSQMDIQALHHVLMISSKADRQIKGQETGDCWETLLSVCLLFPSR